MCSWLTATFLLINDAVLSQSLNTLLATTRDKDLNVRNALIRFAVHVQSLIKCDRFRARSTMRELALNTRVGSLVEMAIILNKTFLGCQTSQRDANLIIL